MKEILKDISVNDWEKLKVLLSVIPGNEPKEVVTLRVFIDEYKNLIKHNRSTSYLRSISIALNYMVEYFTTLDNKPGLQKSITSISLKDVENFLIYLQQKIKKGYVVYYRNLKAAFNKAKEWGYVKENYFTKVKLPKHQKLAPVFIDCDQLTVICDQIQSDIVKYVVVFAFYTGMRLNEIVNLRWNNIDLQNRLITIGDENFKTKGRKQRFVPICEEVIEVLNRMKSATADKSAESVKNMADKFRVKNMDPLCPSGISPLKKWGEYLTGFVFCKENGDKFTGDYFSRRFKIACKAAGMDKAIHFHSLRHSFASNLVQKGVPLYTIKELLGHSSVSTTEIYSHLNMDTLREAIGKFDSGYKILDAGKEHKDGLKIFRINDVGI